MLKAIHAQGGLMPASIHVFEAGWHKKKDIMNISLCRAKMGTVISIWCILPKAKSPLYAFYSFPVQFMNFSVYVVYDKEETL